jgi:hypothetical protein
MFFESLPYHVNEDGMVDYDALAAKTRVNFNLFYSYTIAIPLYLVTT